MADRYLDLTIKESRPGGPWGHKFNLRIRVPEDTLIWNVKTAILEKKEGYDPAGARLYYLGVPMANCRSLADYHVNQLSTLHIMRGAQGCAEAGKSCICATQLQHVLVQNKKEVETKLRIQRQDQVDKLELLTSASSRESALNRVLFLQVESAVLLISSRSAHNTKAAVAALQIAEKMIETGADASIVCEPGSGLSGEMGPAESSQGLFKRLTGVLYPRFRKWPPLLVRLATALGLKPPRRREDE